MKATGIVRRLDDLGRVVIPKEIRRTMRIREGDPLEIFLRDDGIVFKKYSTLSLSANDAQKIRNALSSNGVFAAIFDRDNVLSVPRFFNISVTPDEWINICQPATPWESMFITPILLDGEQIGFICYENSDNDKSIHEMVKLAAKFLSIMAEN